MTEREKMLAGQLYDCGDAELLTQWHKAKDLARNYNQTNSSDAAEKEKILNELLGGKGKNLWITAPFYVDYGNNIYFGNNCEVNMNCTFLDDNIIRIGDNALIAPNVQIYTAFHALYDKVYRDDVLIEAWKRVKANKGSSGVDGIRIEDIEKMGIEKYLKELKKELREGKYIPF